MHRHAPTRTDTRQPLQEKKELAKQQARGLAVGATRKGTVTSVEPPQGKNGMVSITVNLASNVHGVVLTDSPGELKQGDVVRVAVTDIGTKRSGSQIRLALLVSEGREGGGGGEQPRATRNIQVFRFPFLTV